MPKAINDIAPKGTITFLIIAGAASVLMQGYTVYPETLVLIRNHIASIDNDVQESIAKIVTLVIQILSFGVLGCGYWSFLRFERDIPNAYLPALLGSFPMLFILLAWLELTT